MFDQGVCRYIGIWIGRYKSKIKDGSRGAEKYLRVQHHYVINDSRDMAKMAKYLSMPTSPNLVPLASIIQRGELDKVIIYLYLSAAKISVLFQPLLSANMF